MVRKSLMALAAAASIGTVTSFLVRAGDGHVAGAATPPVVVPLGVVGGQGSPGGASPIVEVRVGTSQPVPVILDTGSSGLHIFASAIDTTTGSGVSVTSQKSDITYAGGHRFTGVVASAVVTIGSQATAGSISLSLVNGASCIASKPNCAAAGGIAGFEADKNADGILGIGTQSSQGPVTSPILAMPGTLGQSWSVHLSGTTGTLVLGAPSPPSANTVATFQMKSFGTTGGLALWNDAALPLCTTIGSTQACTPGLFDTGTPSFQVSGPVLGQLPTISASGQVQNGLPVAVAQKGADSPFWDFTTGASKSQDLVRVESSQGPFVNTGVQAFYEFTIHYDDVHGTVAICG
jgi:PE-PGRS C-terminal aspartyl peptidase-like domain/Protein of unknown function (DUF3443)